MLIEKLPENNFSIKEAYLSSFKGEEMKKRVFYNFLFFISVLLFTNSCSNDPIGIDESKEIFPLNINNFWEFKYLEPDYYDNNFKVEIVDTMHITYMAEKYIVYKQATYFNNSLLPDIKWLYWKGEDGIYFMGGISSTDTLIVKELNLKYPANIGDSWQCRSISYSPVENKFFISDTITYTLENKDIEIETPAGKYKCYEYQFKKLPEKNTSVKWIYKNYYSPGIGYIGNVTISDETGELKNKYLLEFYRVK